MKIDILGGCVSRDGFAMIDNDFTVNNYFARTSLISLYSEPLSIELDKIGLVSAFQARMVYNDLTKLFANYFKNANSDLFVIDFVSERLSIIKTNGTYITRSSEFAKSKLEFPDQEIMRRENIPSDLWYEKARLFIEDLKRYGEKKVILHKVYQSEKYRNKEGIIESFKNIDEIRAQNKLFRNYYNFIEEHLENINVIDISEKYISDENHKWGLAPYHFESSYYDEFMDKLETISKQIYPTKVL